MREKAGDTPLPCNSPFDEDNRTVAMENFFQPVCDGDNRLSSFMKRAQHIKQLAASLGIEHSSRFIEYKTGSIHRERSGDRETLFLAAGKRIGRLLAFCEKPGGTQGIFDAEYDLFRREPLVLGTECGVFLDHRADDLVFRVLKDHRDGAAYCENIIQVFRRQAENSTIALRRRQQGVQMFRQGGFARSVAPEKGEPLPFPNPERYAGECGTSAC